MRKAVLRILLYLFLYGFCCLILLLTLFQSFQLPISVNEFSIHQQCLCAKPTVTDIFNLPLYLQSVRQEEINYWKQINLSTMSPKQIINYLHWTNRSSCGLVHDFGGHIFLNPSGLDGQKAICLDPIARPEAFKCFAYSFGINFDWSFDEAIEKYGCEVFSFDPSMNVANHNHSKWIYFYNLGLSDRDYINEANNWTLKTLSSIHQMLLPVHGSEIIDYLKIDIEFAEWDVLPQILESGMISEVRQLGVEFHLRNDSSLEYYRKLVSIVKSIEDAGMIRFDSKYNPWSIAKISSLNDYEGPLAFEIAFYQILPK